MASGQQPSSPDTPGHGSSPFVPFVQETQKAQKSTGSGGASVSSDPWVPEPQMAHHSTSSGPPQSMQRSRGFRIPPSFLGLLLALAVAVPTVIATLPQSGQAPSDGGGAAPSLQRDAPPETGSPPAAGREPADPAAPPDQGADPPDQAPPADPPDQAPPADPPAADPGLQQRQAVEDCLASLPDPSAGCESVLGEDAGAASLYLDCREAGAAAENCLSVLRGE
jgi:hypothetical protein